MKVYIQTQAEHDPRPKVLVMETADAGARAALAAIVPTLGTLIAIPAAAQEQNLKALVARDLQDRGIQPGPAEDGESATLHVQRTPQEGAEVWNLSYELK